MEDPDSNEYKDNEENEENEHKSINSHQSYNNEEEDPNNIGEPGNTAIHKLVKRGDEDSIDSVYSLLTKNGSVNKTSLEAKNKRGMTPLMIAVELGHEVLVELFLEVGADTEANDNWGNTSLMIAAQRGDEVTVAKLLEFGANKEATNKNGNTVLIVAYMADQMDIVEQLLNKGANINTPNFKKGFTLLMIAVERKDTNVIEFLLKMGAETTMKDKDGRTAFDYANGQYDMIHLLLQFSPSITVSHPIGRKLADYSIYTQLIPLLNRLIQGIDINDPIIDQLVEKAILSEKFEIVKFLLEKGAILKMDPTKLLILAIKKNERVLVGELLDKGADPNKGHLLLLAIESGNIDMVRFLIQKGAKKTEAAFRATMPLSLELQRLLSPRYHALSYEDFARLERSMSDIFVMEPKMGEVKPASVNCSMCPVCNEFVTRSAACNYMDHKCFGYFPMEIFLKYKDSKYGKINWCTVCNRVATLAPTHHHYALARIEDPVPGLAIDTIVTAGVNRHYANDCVPVGGGGLIEKCARFIAYRNELGALKLAVDAATAEAKAEAKAEAVPLLEVDASRRLIWAFWNAPFDKQLMKEAATSLESKAFPPVAAFHANSSSSASSASSSVNPENVPNSESTNKKATINETTLNVSESLPSLDFGGRTTYPNKDAPPTVEEAGTDANGNKEYTVTLHHKEAPEGLDEDFDLEGFMVNLVQTVLYNSNPPKCPYCPAIIYPEEIFAILEMVKGGLTKRRQLLYYKILKKYTDRFNERKAQGQFGGRKTRRSIRSRLTRRKKVRRNRTRK